MIIHVIAKKKNMAVSIETVREISLNSRRLKMVLLAFVGVTLKFCKTCTLHADFIVQTRSPRKE